jgi:two-component system, LytTR family, response regulator
MSHPITCIIIDDEVSGRLVLKELISKFCSQVRIIGEAGNIQDAYELIVTKKPDLILLDIQMPGGSGFDLLRKFDTIDFEVVFVTSFDKFAINAIKFSALDYLLKPVEVKDLVTAMEKASEERFNSSQRHPVYINLLNNLDESVKDKMIPIHHNDRVKMLKLSEIICFEADSNYTNIFTSANEKFSPAKLLKDFEDFLADHPDFMRVSKSAIINLSYIKEYSKGDPCILYMRNGKEFEVSRRKKAELTEKIKK